MQKDKVPKKKDDWKSRGFSCPYHAEMFYYFNRKDTEEDQLEIQEYCGD
ncbi:hypothetical protein [Pseudoalteromonas phage PH357]|nr:hypothetical protein [Pseudoalteromonas phage PH357]